MVEQDLMDRFAYHPPRTEAKRMAHEDVRNMLGTIALELNGLLPEGREKALAITNLEQVMFWANAAIARAES